MTFQPVSSRSPSLPWIPKVFLSTAAIAAAVGATVGTLLQSQVLFSPTATDGTPSENTNPSFFGMRLGTPKLPFLKSDQSFPPRQGWPIYEIPDPTSRRAIERPVDSVNVDNRSPRFWEGQDTQEWSQPRRNRPASPGRDPADAPAPGSTADRQPPVNAVNLREQPGIETNPANDRSGMPTGTSTGTSTPKPAVDNSPPQVGLDVPPPAAPAATRAPESSPAVAPPPPPPPVLTSPPPPASVRVTAPPPAPVAPPPASTPPSGSSGEG